MHRHIELRHINRGLFGLIIAIDLYIVVAPFVPAVTYWWQAHHTHRQTQLATLVHHPATASTQSNKPNSLIIPKLLLDQPTLEGPESNWFDLLYRGIWRWPASSTPDKGGNTVFLAHRFSYTGPHGAFYYLDKLKPGDEIGVIWKHQTYTYKVASSRTVPPTDTAIENNTKDARLTLFTCTPLWHPVDRLVVVAELEKAK